MTAVILVISFAGIAVLLGMMKKHHVPAASSLDGQQVYNRSCVSCHGGVGPGGGMLRNTFSNRNELKKFISSSMPDNAPGSLSEREYDAVARYLWDLNKR